MDKMWFGLSILLFSVAVFIAIVVACLRPVFTRPTGEFKDADEEDE